MARNRFNRSVYLLEALNSLGTSIYFNYLFFYLKTQYGYTNYENLLVGALNGFVYVPFAFYGGKFGQKFGYLTALIVGFIVMCAGLSLGALSVSATGVLVAMCVWTTGMCFTWPNLEALACDHQPAERLPGVIGTYNVVWSGAGALALFGGGALAQTFGWRSIFWIPLLIHIVQIAIAFKMRPAWRAIVETPRPHGAGEEEGHPEGPLFLKLAWLANPFAYIAINATIPMLPDLAARFHLSPAFAGFFCSIWFFSRALTFLILSWWTEWHYQFKHLALAFAGMVLSFLTMLLVPSLTVVVLVQILFGWCLGLIYYSSLYYSMHVGETKGEHGGMHEAAIGLGIFGGPAIGAASLYLVPGSARSNVVGVALVLAVGYVILFALRRVGRARLKAFAEPMAEAVSGKN